MAAMKILLKVMLQKLCKSIFFDQKRRPRGINPAILQKKSYNSGVRACKKSYSLSFFTYGSVLFSFMYDLNFKTPFLALK